jgi:hypothetical protein
MSNMTELTVENKDGILVVDSRLIAQELRIEHKSLEDFLVSHFGYAKEKLSILDILGVRAKCFTYSDFNIGFNLDKLIDFILYNKEGLINEEDRCNIVWMWAAIKYESLHNFSSSCSELGGVHPWFRSNYQTLIPNSKLIPVISKNKKRPDFLVDINGKVFPVECKRKFTAKSLKQLLGYMKLWKVKTGYAVAEVLKCELPSFIVFFHSSKQY